MRYLRSDGVQCTVLDYCLPTRRRHYMARPSNTNYSTHCQAVAMECILIYIMKHERFGYLLFYCRVQIRYEQILPVQCLCPVWEEAALVAETPQSMFSQSSSQVRQLIIGRLLVQRKGQVNIFWASEIFFWFQ